MCVNRIFIIVEGGVVTSVYSIDPDVEVEVIDLDENPQDTEGIEEGYQKVYP